MNIRFRLFGVLASCAITSAAWGSEPAGIAAGAPPQVQAADSPESTCFATLTTGREEGRFSTCVTRDGNLKSFQVGVREHLSVVAGQQIEGYAVCGAGPAQLYDGSELNEAGWLDPVITQPGGPNSFPLTIERTSSDGALRLAQTFYAVPSRQTVIVAMALTNISDRDLGNISVARYFNADVDRLPTVNEAHTSRYGVTVWRNPGGGQLQLSSTSTAFPARTSLGRAEDMRFSPLCGDFGLQSPTASGVDVAGKVSVSVTRLLRGTTKRVNFVYSGN